jgi:plasmid stabilization system protein ParE
MLPFDIAFSIRAGRDLQAIRRYLRENASDRVAERVLSGIFAAIETLQEFPERYPPEPLLVQYGNYRVIRKGSYKIFYEFTGFDIFIVRVVHTKRDLKRILQNFRP